MAANSKIEWTDATWNPVRGCTRVSEGCRNCYAEAMAARFSEPGQWGHGFAEIRDGKPRWTGVVRAMTGETLTLPLRWRKPKRIFVNSTSDLFHEALPDEAIDRIFAVMALCPQHTFQILTKRPDRMRSWFAERWQPAAAQTYEYPGLPAITVPAQTEGENRRDQIDNILDEIVGELGLADPDNDAHWTGDGVCKARIFDWPLPNVWLGTSVEDQGCADERIPLLLDTPAAMRFISAEPMIGPMRIEPFLMSRGDAKDAEKKPAHHKGHQENGCSAIPAAPRAHLDWVIAGGESGPNARPMHPAWTRSLRDQCEAAGVPFFFKQWGEHHPDGQRRADGSGGIAETPGEPIGFGKIGKARAGRLLDGVEHNEFPAMS